MEIKLLRIVVASPGDVQVERDGLEEVVKQLNRGIAADRNLRLEVVRWETDAHPGFHTEGPQGLIDPILRIEDSDILVGIFWKRFGTPTKDAKSGTGHEILRAYKAWKDTRRPQIMVYFNQKAATPKSQQETDQWGEVLKFKSEFPDEGLWWDYDEPEVFRDLVHDHLTAHIRQLYKLPGQVSEKDVPVISSAPKIIELFLASSSELKEDREQIEIWISRKNKKLIKKGIFLQLNMLEDYLDAMSQTRLQDEYNKVVAKSDIFISLFATKIGKYTEEEFEIAYGKFKKTGKPKYVYTYFKDLPINISAVSVGDLDSLIKFREKLANLGHLSPRYTSIEDLKKQLDNQLDRIILEEIG